MGLVAQTIKSTAEAISNIVYLQVSDPQKIEFELSKKALKGKTAIVYFDLPEISINQNPLTVTEEYPIQIWFVQLQPEADDVSVEGVLDATKAVWGKFYNDFVSNITWNNLELTDDISLNAGTAYRLGNEVLTGWEFSLTLNVENCPAEEIIYDYDFRNSQTYNWDLNPASGVPPTKATEEGILIPSNTTIGLIVNDKDPIPDGNAKVIITIVDKTGGISTPWRYVQGAVKDYEFNVQQSGIFVGDMIFDNAPTSPQQLLLNGQPDRDFIIERIQITKGVIY